jgi:thiol-disulfide isomerase/thioredoxin
MKIKFLTALLALLLLGGTLLSMQLMSPQDLPPQPSTQHTETLNAFPDVIFQTADGHPLDIRAMKEQVVLVHFWAAWCAVCYTEFPDLLKYVANSHGKVALLSVSLDDSHAESAKALNKIAAKNHLAMSGPNLYWAWDKDKNISLKIFNTVKVPETIIVDDKRQMVDKIIGLGPWSEASVPQ